MSRVFERCDADTMTVIDTAIAEARTFGHNYVGTEHLLVAGLVQHRDLLPPRVVRVLPDGVESVRAALEAALDGPPPRDEELLASLGASTSTACGEPWNERSAPRPSNDSRARRPVRQPWPLLAPPPPPLHAILARGTRGSALTPRVKRALERGLAGATRRGLAAVDPCALLLGMVDEVPALSNRLLRDLGGPGRRTSLHAAAILRAAS